MLLSQYVARGLAVALLALGGGLAASAQFLTNTGTTVAVQPGLLVTVQNGAVLNMPGGVIINNGTVLVGRNFTNSAAAGNLSGTGLYRFIGTANQTLQLPGGSTLANVEVANSGAAGTNRLLVPNNLTITGQLSFLQGLLRTAPSATITLPVGATLAGETTGRYVQGNLEVLRNVSGSTNFGHGVVIDNQGQNLGLVSAVRTAGLLTADLSYGTSLGANPQGIDRIWSIEPVSQPTTPVTVGFSWLADDDHGLSSFTAAQLWEQPTVGTAWAAVSAPTNAASRSISGSVSSLKRFTVSGGAAVAAAPTLTSITANSGPLGSTVALTGTNLTGATAITFSGAAGNVVTAGFTVAADGLSISGVVVPAGASSGLVTVTTPNGTTTDNVTFTVIAPTTFPDLVISTTGQTVAAGTYNSITVTGTGAGTLQGSVVVNATVIVQAGGTLSTNCQPLTGAATFTVQVGGTLIICDPAGISQSAGTGAVQTTGVRSFSNDAHYIYAGSVAQMTGDGLPGQVRSLSSGNPMSLTLTQALDVKQRVRLTATGNLVLNDFALTLLSDASGTALVSNEDTGIVQGATATMQRYIDPSQNSGAGYRHYSTPVSGATVASLATPGFTPVFNSAYNGSATPGAVTPFPTVFGYNQGFIAAHANNLSVFDKGWFSPAGPSDPLAIGKGYTVQIGATEKVNFTGQLNSGTEVISNLGRGSDPAAGWQLIGNPYPAPLDWGNVSTSQLSGIDAAAYVFSSTGLYSGAYQSYVNGVGAGTGLIAAGQGFFVRTSTAGTPGSVTLTNANRLTTFGATQPVFQRGTASTRPLLRLSLGLGSQPATVATAQDEAFVYYETGATTRFDGAFDAHKIANPSAYYLATALPAAGSTPAKGLSIDGRPLLTPGQAEDVVPLWLNAPAGTYTLTATELANFATLAGGSTVYLRDALTGMLTNLTSAPSYTFTLAAGAAFDGRFALVFRPASPLATRGALGQTQASVYPNPASAGTMLAVTALPAGVAMVQATMLNALGQVVGRYTLPVTQGAAQASVPTAGLAGGVYLLRLNALDAHGQTAGTIPALRLSVR